MLNVMCKRVLLAVSLNTDKSHYIFERAALTHGRISVSASQFCLQF